MSALVRREASVSAVELGDQWGQSARIRTSRMQQYKRFALPSLSEPKIRRSLLASHHEDTILTTPAVVSELAAPFSMGLSSLMQHLRVLESGGLVTSQKHGRVRTVSLRPGALDVSHLWLGEQRTPAEHQADRLAIPPDPHHPEGNLT